MPTITVTIPEGVNDLNLVINITADSTTVPLPVYVPTISETTPPPPWVDASGDDRRELFPWEEAATISDPEPAFEDVSDDETDFMDAVHAKLDTSSDAQG